jgi:glycosyltransferase involved in cell wall biosynthesis
VRILIVSQYFWPENFQINFISKLLSKQSDIDVLTGIPNYPEGKFFKGYNFFTNGSEKFGDINIYRVPILPRCKNRFSLFLNYISFCFFAVLISPFALRRKKYDVIFVYGVSPILQVLPAIFLSFLKKTPIVLWAQDLWPESVKEVLNIKSKILLYTLKKVVTYCYSRSSLILVQSNHFKEEIKALSPKSKIIYHPNTVDEIFLKKYKEKRTRDCKKNFSVVFAGNIGEAQSIETIVSAALMLTKCSLNIKIMIYGSGSKANWLKEEIKHKKIKNIIYKGRYPLEHMPKVFNNADALLITLKNANIYNKTIPNKIQAYLASGKPIIGSLNGAGADIIKESRSGLVSEAEDYVALTKNIIKLSKLNYKELATYGKNGRSFFDNNFDPNTLVNSLLNHFDSVSRRKNN